MIEQLAGGLIREASKLQREVSAPTVAWDENDRVFVADRRAVATERTRDAAPSAIPQLASGIRRRMKNALNFPPNFERLVLGCIDADFCK